MNGQVTEGDEDLRDTILVMKNGEKNLNLQWKERESACAEGRCILWLAVGWLADWGQMQ